MSWTVVDVGCLECGEDTQIVGVVKTEAEAQLLCDKLYKAGYDFTDGQHEFYYFKTPKLGVIAKQYKLP